jgi:hypothetical protein
LKRPIGHLQDFQTIRSGSFEGNGDTDLIDHHWSRLG